MLDAITGLWHQLLELLSSVTDAALACASSALFVVMLLGVLRVFTDGRK